MLRKLNCFNNEGRGDVRWQINWLKNCFSYLNSIISWNGGCNQELDNTITKGNISQKKGKKSA